MNICKITDVFFLRMGFTHFEKEEFRDLMRDFDKIQNLLDTLYPVDVIEFLRSQGLLKQTRDYCIMSKKSKHGEAKNIVVTYLIDPETSLKKILEDWQSFLSPPVRTIFYIYF